MSDCFSSRVVTARKAHRCQECRTVMQPGAACVVQSGIYDSRPWRRRLCEPCAALAAWAFGQGGPLADTDPESRAHLLLADLVETDIVLWTLCADGPDTLRVAPEYAGVLAIDAERQYPVLRAERPR